MDLEKIEKGFGALFDMDEKELDVALGGRGKYCRCCLRPLPFEGISVIDNISLKEASRLGLDLIAQEIRGEISRIGLQNKIAFVATESFHVTTFDLINRVEHEERLGLAYPEVRAQVEAVAHRFVSEYQPFGGLITVAGLSLFAPEGLKLDLSLPAETLATFQEFRKGLHECLGRIDHYDLVRDRQWNRPLSSHITIGYFVDKLTRAELDGLKEFLMAFNNRFVQRAFMLSKGEVTQFRDMDHYSAVTSGR